MKQYQQFNTHRAYSQDGQIIQYMYETAERPEWERELGFDGDYYRVVFFDRSRMICGEFYTERALPDDVLRYYDNNSYVSLYPAHPDVACVAEYFRELS